MACGLLARVEGIPPGATVACGLLARVEVIPPGATVACGLRWPASRRRGKSIDGMLANLEEKLANV